MPSIAVIGGGLAGLATAWRLAPRHQVTLLERHAVPGMDAHSMDLAHDGVTARIDVPLRVIYAGYYPTLTALYREVGVAIEATDYSGSFSRLGGEAYFRYANLLVAGASVPLPATPFGARFWHIARDLLRFYRIAPRALAVLGEDDLPLGAWLDRHRFGEPFAAGFLVPTFAAIGTCSYDAVRAYPARVILEYLTRGLTFGGVQRVILGTREVVARLTRGMEVRCGVAVRSVAPVSGGVEVRWDGGARTFDHVVLASQANQAARLLDPAFGRERAALEDFAYEASEVLVHTDPALAPRDRRHWAPVNIVVADGQPMPMATIWLNRVQRDLRHRAPVFQTWNPIVAPAAERVLATARFERPVVDARSVEASRTVARLHAEPGRRLWCSGSYLGPGVPLLEAAAAAATRVAAAIDRASAA